ncbi:hypothetical protein [Streptomyces cyaneofuscatus]|uniref:hypothetical protein n=1 Tax=Streptomyces cyaneofuscatus TaxID=66883 RepID=UPI0037B5A1D2
MGSLRLAHASLTGTAFPMVTGADLAVLQRGDPWSTRDTYDTECDSAVMDYDLGQGEDLAALLRQVAGPACRRLSSRAA